MFVSTDDPCLKQSFVCMFAKWWLSISIVSAVRKSCPSHLFTQILVYISIDPLFLILSLIYVIIYFDIIYFVAEITSHLENFEPVQVQHPCVQK